MLFKLSLFSGLFLTSVALADNSSPVGVRAALDHEIRRSGSQVYSSRWGGAFLNGTNNTVTSIIGTFNVPTLSGANGTDIALWAAIDGDTDCENGPFGAGINAQVTDDGNIYGAFAQWNGYSPVYFPEIAVCAGDTISVNVTIFSHTSGIAIIENLTTTKRATFEFSDSGLPLCQNSAEWVVVDYGQGTGSNGAVPPFASFSTVTFTNASVFGPSGVQTPCDTGDLELNLLDQQANDGSAVTSVALYGCDILVDYVGA